MRTYICEYCGAAFDAEKNSVCPSCGGGVDKETMQQIELEQASRRELNRRMAADVVKRHEEVTRRIKRGNEPVYSARVNIHGNNNKVKQGHGFLSVIGAIVIITFIIGLVITLYHGFRGDYDKYTESSATVAATETKATPGKVTGSVGERIENVDYAVTLLDMRDYKWAGYQKLTGLFDCVEKVPVAFRLNVENIGTSNVRVAPTYAYYLDGDVKVSLESLTENDNERGNLINRVWLSPGRNEVGYVFYVIPVKDVGYNSVYLVYNDEVTIEINDWRSNVTIDTTEANNNSDTDVSNSN